MFPQIAQDTTCTTGTEHSGVGNTTPYIHVHLTQSHSQALSLMPENEVAITSPFLDCLAPEHEHCKEREPGNETEVIVNKDATNHWGKGRQAFANTQQKRKMQS